MTDPRPALPLAPFLAGLGRRPRILILGHARHGKDTAAALLARLAGLSFASSSEFAARRAVFPLVADLYPDWRAAYADRGNHRALWFHAIAAYNLRPGPSLAEEILADHAIYVGMRSRAEFARSRRLFDLVLWIDAARRLPPEPAGSMELAPPDADLVIANNGDEAALEARLRAALFG
ncbi:hypothetical protein R5H32_16150 [Defluviimonas sp. D31]|uniref:hypothetical protein n=1 Tax=Defluviimonas sp. D31 TaxID=3083253 RepID=UPI00296FA9A0|nr:hypothetical protein [Defluviimonas sp. D31]MDW4550895.1 hypothetical protein [Defluviimonas sp. D31]